jgi:phosphoribosylaminoimidazole-succinocarboxamide synthase
MARRKKVYEGKAKILYEGPEPGTLIQYFKDEAAQGVSESQSQGSSVEGRGVLNNRLSEFFMAGLNSIGVPTHFIRRLNMREQLVRMAEIIPLQVVVRNFAAGELSQRLGIPEGMALPRPIVEYYYKDERLNNPMVSEEHIIAFGWANQQDLDDMIALALRVNDFLSGVMMGVGIRLADFRIEVGRIWEGDFMRLIVADEISPDSCRLWDLRGHAEREATGAPAEPGPLADVYTELARRLGVLPSNVTHAPKPTLIN